MGDNYGDPYNSWDDYLNPVLKRTMGPIRPQLSPAKKKERRSARSVIGDKAQGIQNLRDVIARTFGVDGVDQIGSPMSEGLNSRPIPPMPSPTVEPDIGRILSRRLTPQPGIPVGSDPLTSPQELNRARTLRDINSRTPLDVSAATDPLAELESKIMELATPVTTPDRWVSPYSQDYLNGLGNRITQSGISAREQLAAAKQDILDNYQMGLDQRATENQQFSNELQNNAANIGVNYQDSTFGQRASSDAAFLDQMAQQNQATDLSYNDKLGGLFANIAANLGSAAREGLLTPKQFIPGSTELPAGAREQIDFLKEKYRNLINKEEVAAAIDSPTTVTQTVEEDLVQSNPLFADLVASQADPRVRDALQTYYNLGGGNVPEALKIIADKVANPEQYDTGSFGMGADFFGNVGDKLRNELRVNQERALLMQLQSLLQSISPTYLGVPTGRTVTNQSKTNVFG